MPFSKVEDSGFKVEAYRVLIGIFFPGYVGLHMYRRDLEGLGTQGLIKRF